MKITPFALVAGVVCFVLVAGVVRSTAADSPGIGPSFKGPLGVQLYTFRDHFKTDVPGTMEEVRKLGFKYVEPHDTYGLSTVAFKAQLDAHGLTAIGMHFPYERFRDDLDGVMRDAKILGLQYVGCAWIQHDDPFDEKTCRAAIAVFNQAGETAAKNGLHFFSHTHGYEFQPYGKGTLFDLMMAETKPEFVSFEMDVFWIVHAGQDPVKLFEKYPGRWCATHLKGMKDSTPTGLLTGHSDVSNDVAIGTGKIDFPPLLRAAEKAGVKWNFIEDESPSYAQQIPVSLHYLETVKW